MELGCGLGLTAISAALGGARTVWATDGDASLLVKTQENARRNAREQCEDGSLRTRKLFWYGGHMASTAVHGLCDCALSRSSRVLVVRNSALGAVEPASSRSRSNKPQSFLSVFGNPTTPPAPLASLTARSSWLTCFSVSPFVCRTGVTWRT